MKQITLFFVIFLLLFSGSVRSAQDKELSLLSAIYNDDVAGLRKLLENKKIIETQLDPVCKPRRLCKPIVAAARKGSIEMVSLLLEAGADIEGAGGFSKDTALIVATMQQNIDLASFLVKNGADVNRPNRFGATPFLGACAMGLYDLVKLYISNKANIDYPGRFPDPLQKDKANRPIIENITPLMMASLKGDVKIVELLIRNGASVNSKDTKGRVALDYAKANGNPSIINLLNRD